MRLVKSRLKLLPFLLLVFASTSAAEKLRGARTRRANEAEKMLFTEGLEYRKGGGKNNDDSWGSGDGNSYDPESAASYDSGADKQKGETIYDRPAMKLGKESEPTSKETANKETSSPKLSGNKEATKMSESARDKGVAGTKEPATKGTSTKEPSPVPVPLSSNDEMPPPKESPKGESSSDNTAYDEENTEESEEKEGPKPAAKGTEERDGGSTPGKPASAPATSPGRGDDNDHSQTQMSQVAYVLSRFGLEYALGNQALSALPMTTDFAEVEAATIAYISEYLKLTYDADATIFFDSVEIEATSRRTGGTGGTPFIDYEASVAFAEDSPMIPTPLEIGQTISEAFQEPNLSAFALNLSNRLSTGNPFISTTKVTLFVPDSSDGRVAKPNSSRSMSAAGIAAAAGTGVLTLLVGGFLVYKIRNENMEINGVGKAGYAGGLTLAGDTLENSTLRNEDAHSLDDSLYNDDRGFLANLPNGAVLGRPIDEPNQPRIRSFNDAPEGMIKKKAVDTDTSTLSDDVPSAYSSEDEEDHERYGWKDSADEGTFQDEDQADPSDVQGNEEGKEIGLSSLVGRTRALVPTFKSSHMSNSDIKNYFKAKYNCGSPKGYEAVGESTNGDVQPCPSDDQSLNLVLPALDHSTAEEGKSSKPATKQKYPDYESAYMQVFDDDDDDSVASSTPSDEENKEDEVSTARISLGESRLATDPQKGDKKRQGHSNVVPKLPSEQGNDDDGESGSEGPRQMDDVSLGPN